MEARLPAHLEVSALIRAVEAAGGFATVIARGERDAGTILILTVDRCGSGTLYERMPHLDGTRQYHAAKQQTPENKQEFDEYVRRRSVQDGDCWIVELDVPNPERFIAFGER